MYNLKKTISDFCGVYNELSNNNVSPERKLEIRNQAIDCFDLMNYSYEVADTRCVDWCVLEWLIDEVLVLTN